MNELEHLFKTNYKALCLYATHLTGDIDAAEDVVMDCFLALTEQRERGEQIFSPRNYLYRMVRNACLDRAKTKTDTTDMQNLPDLPDDEEECRERCEREARLWEEIDHLPRACRRIFLLHKREGMRYKDIADTLGISVKTVEAQIGRAYAVLRGKAGKIYAFFL